MSSAIEYINNTYDIRDEYSTKIEYNDNPLPNHEVIAIIGGSGTGKSTLLKHWFNIEDLNFKIDDSKSIFEHLVINDTHEEYESVSKLLFNVGLASVPIWKNPFKSLSNGEKLRFEIAYKIKFSKDIFYIDEFTSMLDRQTAKNLTLKLNELLRNYNKKIVIATAHFDILDWLEIDLLVDTTLKKYHAPQKKSVVTHMTWKSMQFQESCGAYLSNITI